MNASICIVTPGYLSSTPRVVKEADALQAAGMDVRVVHTQGGLERARDHDRKLLRKKEWCVRSVGWAPNRSEEIGRYVRYTAQQRLAQWITREAWRFTRVAEQVEHRIYPALARRAAEEPAHLYIGHYPAGLAAAAYAANEYSALLGYDAEDFHVGQHPNNRPQIERTDFIERRYLSKCAYVTAASEGIATALADRYKINRPKVIANVFPWAERDTLDGKTKDRRGNALSLYWFSQTVGLDRGLQDAIRAAGLLDVPIQLHIRGTLHENVERKLRAVAEESGIKHRIHFHPQVPPGELLSRTAEHDVGLALEQGHTPNRSLCVTNKLYYYPLAGLPIAATNVEGQRRVLAGRSDLSGLYEPGNVAELAQVLSRWKDNEALRISKMKALETARAEWNWEAESQKLVHQVEAVIEGAPTKESRNSVR